MTGLGQYAAILWRSHRRQYLIWTLSLIAAFAATAGSVANLYKTPAQIASYGEAILSDALVAINGRVEGLDTLGGIIQDEFSFLATLLMPLVGIALVAATTRGEEDSGRLEAVLAGRIDRRAPVVAALLLLLGVVAVLIVGFTISLLAVRIEFTDALLYALSLGLVTVVFGTLAALCTQVVLHSREIYFLGFGFLALAYALRGIGDVTETFWVWLSPLGWLERTAPFAAHSSWWVLVIPVLVSALIAGAALVLAWRRDLGAAAYRPGPGPTAASRSLVDPIGLAVTNQRGSFLGWMAGGVGLGAMMGALARQAADAMLSNEMLREPMGITRSNAADLFLAYVQLYLTLIACGYVVQSLSTLRREESEGRLETLLAGARSRSRWLAAQLVVVLVGLVILIAASALTFAAAAALTTGESRYFGVLIGAGFAYLPAVLVITALVLALYAAAPRAFAAAWVGFGLITALSLLGVALQLPQWVLDLSPLTHVGQVPAEAADRAALVVLFGLAVLVAVFGFVAFGRRQIPKA